MRIGTAGAAGFGGGLALLLCGLGPEHRFYVSRPFRPVRPWTAIEQPWIAWLARQAVRYETTGCPRGADRAAVEASLGSAIRYNAGQGRRASELDWQPTP